MSVLTILPGPRRPCRPRAAESRATRLERIKWAALILTGALLLKQAAAAAGVTRKTMGRWVAEALGYDDPEAEALRRQLGRTG